MVWAGQATRKFATQLTGVTEFLGLSLELLECELYCTRIKDDDWPVWGVVVENCCGIREKKWEGELRGWYKFPALESVE